MSSVSSGTPDPLMFYATPGPLTTLPANERTSTLLAGLPTMAAGEVRALVEALVQVVQGNLLHIFWAERYGVTLSPARKAEVQIRTAAARLDHIFAAQPQPLCTPRPTAERMVGNCRDFSVMMVALLRARDIPARARCGFGTYFVPGHYEDHWIVEYWHADEARWVQVDAQLDALQREQLGITFDTLDLPPGQFVTGGRAWQLCRSAAADPDDFGIFDMHGLWFVRGNHVRDVAALNKVELLPWDSWGLALGADDALAANDWALLDHAADLATPATNDQFAALRSLYETADGLRVPPTIYSFGAGPQPAVITLADEPGYALP